MDYVLRSGLWPSGGHTIAFIVAETDEEAIGLAVEHCAASALRPAVLLAAGGRVVARYEPIHLGLRPCRAQRRMGGRARKGA